MTAIVDFVNEVTRNCEAHGFRLNKEPKLFGGLPVKIVASREKFYWKALSVITEHVVMDYQAIATKDDFRNLLDAAIVQAKAAQSFPRIRGMQYGQMIFACLAVDQATPEAIEFVTSRPRKRWARFEFPILHDLSVGRTYFYDRTPMWGAWFYSDLRNISRMLFPN